MKKLAQRMKEINERGLLKREASVGAVNREARTVEVSFSSEIEYRRWFGIEILSHAPGACDLDRLNDGAAVLWNHNWNDQRGVVESARIDADKKGRAVLRFSKSEAGEQLLTDIEDEIITKVSVGYSVKAMRLVETRDGEDVYEITEWAPYELSMVSVPADASVGLGRSAEITHEERTDSIRQDTPDDPILPKDPIFSEGDNMTIKTMRDAQGNLVRAKVDDAGAIVEIVEVLEKAGDAERSHVQRGSDAERQRVRAITDLGKQYDQRDMAIDFLSNGKSPDEFQRALLEKLNERKAAPISDATSANLGMSDSEVRNFSVFRAVRAMLPNASQKDRDAAAFEFECSRAAETQYGKEAQGILIPQDVLDRGFNAGGAANSPTGATSGANLVATQLLSGSFIEMLRHRTTIMRLAQTMGGLVGNVEVPKQAGGASAYWLGEGADAGEGTPTITQLGMTPKTVGAFTDITRKLLAQSTPDAEGLVRRDLVAAVAQAIDRAGYYGTGASGQPLGIKNTSGINAVGFTGNNPTYAEIVEMESMIAADNADVDSMAYVLNALARGSLKTTQKFSGTNGAPVWESNNTVNGYRAEVTNQIDAGDYFFGNFADLVVGLWGGLDLTVDPYSLSKSGGTRIVVFQDVDFVIRRLESFCFGKKTP